MEADAKMSDDDVLHEELKLGVKDTDFNSRRKRRDVGAVDMSKQLHRVTESEVTQS
jgi:hypothetical protein